VGAPPYFEKTPAGFKGSVTAYPIEHAARRPRKPSIFNQKHSAFEREKTTLAKGRLVSGANSLNQFPHTLEEPLLAYVIGRDCRLQFDH
jgi:hypothetical protein